MIHFNIDNRNDEARMCSPYIERERSWQNEAAKTGERLKIAKFFLSHHRETEDLRLLSMPGIHWQFEHLLLSGSPSRLCGFVGLETLWGVIELGIHFMPGRRKRYSHEPLAIGEIKTVVSAPLDRCSGASWLWCHAADLTTMRREHKAGKRRFAQKYKRFTCIWLDFTSQLCDEVRRALRSVGGHANDWKDKVPFAVTVMAARDEHSNDDDRTSEIVSLVNQNRFRSLKVWGSWKYVNNNVPMLNVMGTLERKPPPAGTDAGGPP